MAAVPVTISGVLYDKTARTSQAVVLIGTASITGLEVGGGPILPPDQVPQPEPPLVIWGGGNEPFPTPPIVIPPDLPPINPPNPIPPPHEGWNYKPATPDNPATGWYYLYVPGPTDAQPHRR